MSTNFLRTINQGKKLPSMPLSMLCVGKILAISPPLLGDAIFNFIDTTADSAFDQSLPNSECRDCAATTC